MTAVLSMNPVRCLCNRMLFKGKADAKDGLEIKCVNCKRLWMIQGDRKVEIKAAV